MEKPPIFGYVDVDENEPIEFWISKGNMDNFHLIMPKSWDMMIRAGRVNWIQYTLTASLDHSYQNTHTGPECRIVYMRTAPQRIVYAYRGGYFLYFCKPFFFPYFIFI